MANTGPQKPAVPAPPPPPSPQQPTQHAQHTLQLNWSHLSQNFTGKPEEDACAHLLRTNAWMDTHQFQGIKVQRFCLTLVGEARLWYESLKDLLT